MNSRLIAPISLIVIIACILLCHTCNRKPVNNAEVLKKQEVKKEVIKSKIVIEEKHIIKVKEQNATIKKRLTVAKKGLILNVDTLLGDTSKIEQVIKVIELQGLTISADSNIIALQDTLLDHYKQLDSTNTSIIQETKKEGKQAKNKALKKGFWLGIGVGIAVIIAIVSTIK